MRPVLYLMLGFPGAGKTTVSELVADLSGAVHLSSDKIRTELFPKPIFSQAEHQQLYNEIDRRTVSLLSGGKSVIYDANLNRYQHRKEKYDICAKTGAEAKLLWVQTPRVVAKARAGHTNRLHLIPSNETPNDMFERIAGVIEKPKRDEPFTSIDGTKVTKEYIADTLHLA